MSAVNQMVKYQHATEEFHTLLKDLGVPNADEFRHGVRRGESATPATVAVATRRLPPHHKRKEYHMSEQTQTAPPGGNVPTLDSLLDVAKQLGEEAGRGQDTQIKFDLKLLEGAYLGAIDLQPHKHGKDVDDASKLYEAYALGRRHTTVFDAKADTSRKGISNARKCIKLGGNPKWGMGQPLQNVNELVTYRQQQRRDPSMSKKLNDAHNMLMRYATAQLKADHLIDGDELKAFAFKKDAEEVTVEDVLEAIRKKAQNLQAGKVAHCNGMLNTPEVKRIIDACTKSLKDIAVARGQQAAE